MSISGLAPIGPRRLNRLAKLPVAHNLQQLLLSARQTAATGSRTQQLQASVC